MLNISPQEDGLSERQAIRAIAKHTETINKLIWYPFIVLLLIVVARQRVFDGWDYPLTLVVVQLLLLVALYLHTWRLRIEADGAHETIVRALRDRIDALALPKAAADRDHLKGILDDIQKEDAGAFSHWTQDYFLKAMSLPLLGEGGMMLLGRILGPG